MHDLGKCFQQWVRDVVQKRRISIKVGEGLCLELETLAAEIIVDEIKYGAFRGVGRVNGRKCVQDGLLIRPCGLVDERFRVRPELGDVDGLQNLFQYSRHE